jgi:integrase/recombinase XerD
MPGLSPVAEYLDWLAVDRGRSPNTVAAYRRDLESYERFALSQGRSLPEATEELVSAYVDWMGRAGRKPASIARALVAIRSFHRFAGSDAGCAVDAPAVPDRHPVELAEDEVKTLLSTVPTTTPVGRRDRAMLQLLWATGMRISELVGLTLDDVTGIVGGSATVSVQAPDGRRRHVPAGGDATAALATWLGRGGRAALVRTPHERAMFVNARGGRLSRQGAWAVIRQRGEEAGLAGRLTPQVLRRSCAVHLLATGVPPREVQEILGQSGVPSR